jgi:hypothetical protein
MFFHNQNKIIILYDLKMRFYHLSTPMHERKRNALKVFGIDCGLWGSAPGRWTWTMMDRTPPLMLDDFQGTWQLS